MSTKDNFNEALYDMFGIGKNPYQKDNSPKSVEVPEYTAPAVTTPEAATSYIAPGTVLVGTLQSSGNVEIAGTMEGDVCAEGNVKLSSDLKGNVKAANLHLNGARLNGDVVVSGKVLLDKDSFIKGKISADELNCFGVVVGDLSISKNAELKAGASVSGNITTNTLVLEKEVRVIGDIDTELLAVEQGARVKGSINMRDPEDEVPEAEAQPEQPQESDVLLVQMDENEQV